MRTFNFYFECTKCGETYAHAHEILFAIRPAAEDYDCHFCHSDDSAEVVAVEEVTD